MEDRILRTNIDNNNILFFGKTFVNEWYKLPYLFTKNE